MNRTRIVIAAAMARTEGSLKSAGEVDVSTAQDLRRR
jgi:hypothetical protein